MGERNDDRSNRMSLSEDEEFQEIVRSKNRFILWGAVGFLLFYLLLPFIVTGYQNQLTILLGDFFLVFVWSYALALFFVTWTLGWIYWRRASSYDEKISSITNDKPSVKE